MLQRPQLVRGAGIVGLALISAVLAMGPGSLAIAQESVDSVPSGEVPAEAIDSAGADETVESVETISLSQTPTTAVAAGQPWLWVTIALVGLVVLAMVVRQFGIRQVIKFGLPIAVIGGIAVAVFMQIRPQASTVGSDATVTLVQRTDGTFECRVTDTTSTALSDEANTEQLKSAIVASNDQVSEATDDPTQVRTNQQLALETGRELAERKAQLLELAEADPAAAAEVVLADDERAALSAQYADCVEAPTIVTGKVETRIMESFGAEGEEIASRAYQSLTADDGQVLALHSEEPLGSGEQGIQGFRMDSEVIVTATDARKNELWGSGPSPMAAVGSGEQRTLAVLVNFVGPDGQPLPLPTDYTAEKFAEVFLGEIAEFYHEQSNGRLTIRGDVTDWLTLSENPFLTTPSMLASQAFEDLVITSIMQSGRHDIHAYDKLVVFSPNTWKGLAYDPFLHWDGFSTLGESDHFVDPDGDGTSENIAIGVASLLKASPDTVDPGRSKFVIAHEFGHALGAHHANLYGCHDMRSDCIATDRSGFSLDFTSFEYGNRFGMMGNPILYREGEMLDDPAPLKDMRGWYSEADVQEVRASGEYIVRPLEGTSEQGPIALRIPRDRNDVSHGYLYVEYRQDPRITSLYPEVGQGALLNFTNDLMFHSDLLVPDPSVPILDRLFGDTFSKATLTADDAPFVDKETGITVDVVEANAATGLRVAVTLAESAIDPVPVRLDAPEANFVGDATPTFKLGVDRQGAFFVKYRIQITDAQDATIIYDQLQDPVPWLGRTFDSDAYVPGQIASFTPPALPPGKYTWRAQAVATYTAEDNDPFVREGDYSEPRSFEIATPEAYFLFQVQAPHGPANNVVQKLVGVDVVKAARAALAGGAANSVPKGALIKAPNADNPTWGWSWSTSSLEFIAASNSTCAGDVSALEVQLATWNNADFCPTNLKVAQELGTTLPAKQFQLTLPRNQWRLVEVPGANMRLSADSAAVLASGKLHLFKYLSSHGTYDKITDPSYSFQTGEGYIVLSTEGVTLTFEGTEAYANTLHLRQGWNLVSIPSDTKLRLASVYSKSRTYQSPQAAVESKVLYGTAFAAGYSESGAFSNYVPVRLSELSDIPSVERQAVWMLANEDALLQFSSL